MSNNKMKGLLKGLRYISQIFDNEKEPEMQIGFPTDVKHVAHIGWDGPSVTSPSWMNEFKAPNGGFSSSPLNANGEPIKEDNPITWTSEDSSSRRGSRSRGIDKDLPELPKSSRRQSSSERAMGGESPTIDKPKQSRRSSRNAAKDLADGKSSSRYKDQLQGNDSSSSNPPDVPKKTRRKKSKDGSNSKTSRSKPPALDADCVSECGSTSKSVNSEQCETGSSVSAFSTFEEEAENGFSGVS
ncbi:CRIB domain-containing protein RIC7 [Mercurialis annua]|uniref:CRIB domain-containing protein RIC7 n=1 Tax=Mercurialis annua TaxID=3986 RepID=UPI002160AA28|nr:CRIB domain-containing protein RIC7 [Mercurialis annua]